MGFPAYGALESSGVIFSVSSLFLKQPITYIRGKIMSTLAYS